MTEPGDPLRPVVLPAGSGPASPGPGGARRPRPYGDTFGSIALLVLAFGAFLIGMILSGFGFLIADVCSERTCNSDAGVTAQSFTILVLALVLLVGTCTSIVLMVLRRRALWVAAFTLALMIVGWIAGAVAFFVALGT